MIPRRLLFITFLFLIILAAPSIPTSAQDPETPSYRVLYLNGGIDVPIELWSMNPDGSDKTFITTIEDYDPQISPNGRYVLEFPSCYIDDPCNEFNVIQLSSGISQTYSLDHKIADITWSNDSQQFLIRTQITAEDGISTTNDLFILNRDSITRVDLFADHQIPSAGAWSPDDSKILFWAREAFGEDDVLYFINADGTDLTPIFSATACFICQSPFWSPDGQTIYFSQYPDLYRLPIGCVDDENGCEGLAEKLTDFTADYNAVDVAHARYGHPHYSMSSEGDFLIFTFGYRNDTHDVDIGMLPLTTDGWENRHLFRLPFSETNRIDPAILSPDNQHIYFVEGYFMYRIGFDSEAVWPLGYGDFVGFVPN